MNISGIHCAYIRYIPIISHCSVYHRITLKDGLFVQQQNCSVHCTYSLKQYMYSNGWKQDSFSEIILWRYTGYIPEYPREKYMPGIYLVYTRKKILGVPDGGIGRRWRAAARTEPRPEPARGPPGRRDLDFDVACVILPPSSVPNLVPKSSHPLSWGRK